MDIIQNFENLIKKIPSHCKLIAVSKKQPIEAILNLYHLGQRNFAENYSQELIEKQFYLKDYQDIQWHFIGNPQKNKLKHYVGLVEYIHSVGSLETAMAINDIAEKKEITQKVLLQLNLAHESTKIGFTEEVLNNIFNDLLSLSHIKICGLMTLPPIFDKKEYLKPYFKRLRELRDNYQSICPSCVELSMGTSFDYEVAIDEGATMIRLGTILFGPRK